MSWNDKPEISVTAIALDETTIGGKRRVKIEVRGWGKLRVVTKNSDFTAYFAGEKSWILTIPKLTDTQISAANIFGKNQAAIELGSNEKFLSEDDFFRNLKLKPMLTPMDVRPPPPMLITRAVRAKPLANKIRGSRIRVAGAHIQFAAREQKIKIKKWQPASVDNTPVVKDNFRLRINPSSIQIRLRANPLDIDQVFKTINREGAPR
jgi:hypothetical protein